MRNAICNVGIVGEEQDFFAAGLRSLLIRRLSFASVQQVKTLGQMFDALARLSPVSLVTIDAALPGVCGADTIRELRTSFPSTRVAIIAQIAERPAILAALSAGAHGFVPKCLDSPGILLALRVIMSGQIYVPAILAEQQDYPTARHPAGDDIGLLKALTRRQSEIIRLMTDGHSNKMIARNLGISPSAVKVHLHAAFRTLGVHNRVGAISACRTFAFGADARMSAEPGMTDRMHNGGSMTQVF